MFMNLGDVAAGSTLYCPFPTYNAAGASVTITDLATTDIEIYKNGSTTQRSSDAGYTLLDTDGIDFDSNTGIHGFSVDLSDNTDAGFYAAGSVYWLVVASITADSQTVNFGYYFTIDKNNVLRPTTAGRTLDVSSTGAAGIDLNNIELPVGPVPALGIIENGLLQSATASTAVLRAGTTLADDVVNNSVLEIVAGTGIGQARFIVDWVSTTDTASINPDWTVNPDNTSHGIVRAAPPAPTTAAYMPTSLISSGTGTGQLSVTSGVVAANPTQLGGDAQSLTDLKDFADAGYDPSTNKLQGVVLVDTATNLTNLPAITANWLTAAGTAADFGTELAAAVNQYQIPDSYPADGAQPTVAQALLTTLQVLTEAVVSGSDILIKKPDGTTTAITIACSPSVAAATSRTRSA